MKSRYSVLSLRVVIFITLMLIFFKIDIGNTYSEITVPLPKMWVDDEHCLQELNLGTATVTKNSIGINTEVELLERNINIGNGKIVFICTGVLPENHFADHEGYVYYYNKNLKRLINLDFYATDADDIIIKSNLSSTFMVIDFYKRPDYKYLVYKLQPFKLLLSEQRPEAFGKLMDVDDKYVYYDDCFNNVVIRSISDYNEVKRVKFTGICLEIKQGKALVWLEKKDDYQVIDLWSGENRDFNYSGHVNLSDDGEWLIYRGIDRHSFSGKVIVINLNNGRKIEAQLDPEILEKSEKMTMIRLGKAFFIEEKNMTILDLQSGKITRKKYIFQDDQEEKSSPLAMKAKIDDLINRYEVSLIDAINTNKFSLVAKTLTPGSPLYRSQKQLVANLYGKHIQEDLNGYDIHEIRMVSAGRYKVYVSEKIGIKYPKQKEFKDWKYRWVYMIVAQAGRLSLSNLEKWEP